MQQPPPPSLPGLPPGAVSPKEMVIMNEKLASIEGFASPYCFKNCVGFFSEDSIPYHYGERVCMERCADKLYESFQLAKTLRQSIESKVKAGGYTPLWLTQLQQEESTAKH